MDQERAEGFLRRFAEVQLRHALLDSGSARWRVSTVGSGLVRAGALEAGVAEAIDEDVELALAIREPPPPVPRRRSQGRPIRVARRLRYQAGSQSSMTVAAPSRPPRIAERIVPLDAEIPVESSEEHWVLHLLAFCQGGGGAWFAVQLRPADPPVDPLLRGRFSSAVALLNAMRMTDDAGAAYQFMFDGGGSYDLGFHGRLDIRPDLPPGIRWAEIALPGQPPVRISLTEPAADPAVTVTPAAYSPGEYLLHTYAGRLLGQGALHLEGVLGDLVAALQASGVLSPLSPVPGQLARLYELHGAYDHGLAAPAARDEDLPEPWRITGSWVPTTPYPQHRFAAVSVALPELDGVRITILGLANSATETVLHVNVTGGPVDHRDPNLPLLWIRDEVYGWHSTFAGSWSTGGGETHAQLNVSPPLVSASAIDILVCGRSAEVRTTLPVRWR